MARILHILGHSLPLHSDYALRTSAIMKAQEADGYEVRAISVLRQDPTAIDKLTGGNAGLGFHRTPGLGRGLRGLRERREIAELAGAIDRLCEKWRPDVLHAHSPALCGQASARVAAARGIPLVYEIRAFCEDAAAANGNGGDGMLKYWLTRRIENRVIAQADAVVTICQGLRDDLVARGFPAARFTIVPNGVHLDRLTAPPSRDAALARELGLDHGAVIGFIGDFHPYEGADDLIAAMPALVFAHPAARLLLVGGGPCEAALRAQAEASPVASAIRFAGPIAHEDLARYYSLVDIAAYPRKAMRLTELVAPAKPLEAIAHGRIVAASDVGGHRELISDGFTGTLFAPDDPVDLARVLAMLLWRRGEWDRQRAASRRIVEREHDWAKNVQRYRDVYARVLGRAGSELAPA